MTIGLSLQEAGWAFTDEDGVGAAVTNFLRSRPSAPHLLGLGEPMHQEEAFPRLRNQIFQHLVAHEGYRSIALESDCLAGLTVDAFVAGGPGSLDDVMRHGFSHGWGALEANRDLVDWMRKANQDRPSDQRLRFFGFDAPTEITGADSPRPALTALHRYLATHLDTKLLPVGTDTIDRLAGDDERWTNPAAAMDPAQSVGSAPEVTELRRVTDDLRALLMAESPRLVAATSRDDWWQASLHGRTAAGLLRYHAAMADPSPGRMNRLLVVRDTMMAENLLAIAEPQAQHGRTLVFANNSHLQKDRSRMELEPGWVPEEDRVLEWWSAGAIAGTHLGDGYAVITSALGAAPQHEIGPPPTDTLEGRLAALPDSHYLLPAEPLAAALASSGGGDKMRQRSGKLNYAPLDPGSLAGTDAVAFHKHIAPGR
jgi:erythromycin esterase-like protein